MMKRVLILGATGFVGRAIFSTPPATLRAFGLDLVAPSGHVEVTDPAAIRSCIDKASPDWVIHLAAQTFVPESFSHPEKTFEVNFFGTLNVLKALKSAEFSGRLLYVSSGDVYGVVSPEQLPLSESTPLKPRNPYSVSKVAAEALCYQWSQTEGLEVVIVRPFNHIGSGQSERFVVSDFAKQIVEIKLGRREARMTVGDIDVTRDFTDVRDVIRAYFLVLERGSVGEVYNVCSGKEQSIRSLLERMREFAGVDVQLETDPTRLRKQEQRRVAGSYAKLGAATGWKPELSIDESLRDILNYWEVALKNE